MTGTELVLCVVVPDLCIAVFVGGRARGALPLRHVQWHDAVQPAVRTQTAARRQPAAPLRVLAALGGHLMGLLIPKSWTDAAGIPELAHHALCVTLGTIAEG